MRDWADVEPHPVNNSWPVHIGEVHKVHLSPHAAHDGKVSQRTAHHAAGLKHNKQMLVMPDTCSTWVPSVLYRTSTSELSQKNCLSQKKHDLSKKAGAGGAILPVQLWSPPFTAGPAQPNSLKRIAVLKKRFVQESKPFSKQLKQIKMKMKNQGLFLFMALTIFFSIQISLASVAVNRTSVPKTLYSMYHSWLRGYPKPLRSCS